MTAPAPKPIAVLDELRARLGDLLEDARKLFQYPEERCLTILVRQVGEPERDCVVTDDTPEGVLEIVSRRFPRPQQSAEPVAWYDLPMANIELADAIVQEWQKRVESGAPAMPWGTGELVELISKLRPAAFPGPSELVEEMEKLADEWELRYGPTYGQKTHARADDLRALITRHRGKS